MLKKLSTFICVVIQDRMDGEGLITDTFNIDVKNSGPMC